MWKDIKNYEGLYQISDTGEVRSLDKLVTYSNGRKHLYKGKLISPAIHNNYYAVTLHKDGKMQTVYIHRLVAQHYLDNPNNLPYINHKDENKLNNAVSNLEWCTPLYNNIYGNRIEKVKQSTYKKVYQLDLSGNIIKLWNSPTEVESILGIKRASISNCITGRSKSAGGYVWRYADR